MSDEAEYGQDPAFGAGFGPDEPNNARAQADPLKVELGDGTSAPPYSPPTAAGSGAPLAAGIAPHDGSASGASNIPRLEDLLLPADEAASHKSRRDRRKAEQEQAAAEEARAAGVIPPPAAPAPVDPPQLVADTPAAGFATPAATYDAAAPAYEAPAYEAPAANYDGAAPAYDAPAPGFDGPAPAADAPAYDAAPAPAAQEAPSATPTGLSFDPPVPDGFAPADSDGAVPSLDGDASPAQHEGISTGYQSDPLPTEVDSGEFETPAGFGDFGAVPMLEEDPEPEYPAADSLDALPPPTAGFDAPAPDWPAPAAGADWNAPQQEWGAPASAWDAPQSDAAAAPGSLWDAPQDDVAAAPGSLWDAPQGDAGAAAGSIWDAPPALDVSSLDVGYEGYSPQAYEMAPPEPPVQDLNELEAEVTTAAFSELSSLAVERPKVERTRAGLTRRESTDEPGSHTISDGAMKPAERDADATRSRYSSFYSGTSRAKEDAAATGQRVPGNAGGEA